jgi:4-hydroxybenzoate polyprenyltransferase
MFRTRAMGRRLFGSSFDYLLFLRPRQWPILSAQLAVGILSAPAVADSFVHPQGLPEMLSWTGLAGGWLAWVVCLNGGTLAFNSAYDRDENDIAYLNQPPQPPQHLALFSFLLMLIGAGLAFLVTPAFGLVTTGCVLMSCVYSHPVTRWKSIPGRDLVINMVGYGCGTTFSGLIVGQVVAGGSSIIPDRPGWFLILGFCLLFGSLYPLTQIYQINTDRKRGDLTLASALGRRTSLTLAIVLGIAAGCFLMATALQWNVSTTIEPVLPLLGAIAAWIGMLLVWHYRAERIDDGAHEKGMYRALALWAVIDGAVLISRYGFMF